MPVWAIDLCLLVVFLALIITPYGRQKKAAVVHDYLYQNRIGSRKYADDVFYEAMRVEGTWAPKAWLMWTGVRLFGWFSWRR
jgi:lipopolysaccharide export LptBFGC system permease protein LptF